MTALALVPEPELFDGPCWMPYEATIRALMIQHDRDCADLRAQLVVYRQALLDAGIEPPDDTGQDLLGAYHDAARMLTAVYQFFGGDGWSNRQLPAGLQAVFEGQLIR